MVCPKVKAATADPSLASCRSNRPKLAKYRTKSHGYSRSLGRSVMMSVDFGTVFMEVFRKGFSRFQYYTVPRGLHRSCCGGAFLRILLSVWCPVARGGPLETSATANVRPKSSRVDLASWKYALRLNRDPYTRIGHLSSEEIRKWTS